MNAATRMAEAAERYCALIEAAPPTNPYVRCAELVAAISDAVAAAIRLNEVPSDDDPPNRGANLTYDEVRARLKWLPFGLYHDIGGQCLDVAKQPEPLIGDVVDDLADIYLDLGGGLSHWVAGERGHAAWYWCHSFQHHWQYHAAGVVFAMTWARRAQDPPDQRPR